MKKLVVVMGAMKRGSGLSSFTTHRPSCSSCVERKAMELLSGDHRGVEAVQPEGNNGRGAERISGQSMYGAGRRGVGVGVAIGYASNPSRASQSVLTFLSSSTEETV